MTTFETGSIRQIHQRLRDEGYGVTENSLRTWVRQGIVPSVRCGNKAYITFSNVVKVLTEGVPVEETTTQIVKGIRKIS